MCYFGGCSSLGRERAGTMLRDGLWMLNLTRLELQVDTYSVAGVDLDTGFPKALARLRHMGIKETGSREFYPEGITALLFYLLPIHGTTHLWNEQHSRTPVSVDTISSNAKSYKSHPSVQFGGLSGCRCKPAFSRSDFSVPPVPYFQLQSA